MECLGALTDTGAAESVYLPVKAETDQYSAPTLWAISFALSSISLHAALDWTKQQSKHVMLQCMVQQT